MNVNTSGVPCEGGSGKSARPTCSARCVASVLAVAASAFSAMGQCADWQAFGAFSTTSVVPATAWHVRVWDPDGSGPLQERPLVGGLFDLVGSGRSMIAEWNGSSWVRIGAGFDTGVSFTFDLDHDGSGPLPPTLVAYGYMTRSGQTSLDGCALWSNGRWISPYSFPGGATTVKRAGGASDLDGDGPNQPLLWLGTENLVIARDPDGIVQAVAQVDRAANAIIEFDEDGDGPRRPRLFMGGGFSRISTLNRAYDITALAAFDGSTWSSVGEGIGGLSFGNEVYSLRVVDLDGDGPQRSWLIVGGRFIRAGGLVSHSVAAWTGSEWIPLGESLAGTYDVLTSGAYDPDGEGPASRELVIGGLIRRSGQTLFFARWDGRQWTPLGSNALLPVAYGNDLVGWRPPGADHDVLLLAVSPLVTNSAPAVSVFDPSLAPPMIHRHPEPRSVRVGESAGLSSIVVGASPRFHRWSRAGVALFDGMTPWGSSITGSATDEITIANAKRDDEGLYALRVTNACGDVESLSALLLVGCVADFDRDSRVTFFDYLEFVSRFAAEDLEADLDGNGQVDFADYAEFFVAFASNCE